jgi:four helix bundle protein
MQNPDNLRVSRASEDLADLIYDFTDAFPRDERFGLTSQMRRAAVSVGSNIYEGCSRQTDKGLVAFLYVSHGSAGELLFQTRLATRRKFGDSAVAKKVMRQLILVRRMLSHLIRYHERNDSGSVKRGSESLQRAKRSARPVGAAAPTASQRSGLTVCSPQPPP